MLLMVRMNCRLVTHGCRVVVVWTSLLDNLPSHNGGGHDHISELSVDTRHNLVLSLI